MCTLFLPKNAQCRVLSLLLLLFSLLLLLCRQCCVGCCCCCSWAFFSFGSRFPLTSMDSPHRGPTSFDTELTGASAWAFARACQSISLPARWSEILPCSAFSQLCSPPLIAFINYIIKSVMTERPNHLPSSLAGPLFQLNCRVIVCWVPKLPFSCNRPNRPSDRANQLCVPQKPLPLPVDIFG